MSIASSAILSWIALSGTLFAGAWALAGNEVRDTVRGWVIAGPIGGETDLEQFIREQREFRQEVRRGIDDLSQQIDDLDSRLSQVEPPPVYVVFDNLRGRIEEPCPADGGICTYSYRAKRTVLGAQCEAVNLRLYVIDSQAVRVPVLRVQESPIVQATVDDYVTITSQFVLPPSVAPRRGGVLRAL